jgi:hypothetical protein
MWHKEIETMEPIQYPTSRQELYQLYVDGLIQDRAEFNHLLNELGEREYHSVVVEESPSMHIVEYYAL